MQKSDFLMTWLIIAPGFPVISLEISATTFLFADYGQPFSTEIRSYGLTAPRVSRLLGHFGPNNFGPGLLGHNPENCKGVSQSNGFQGPESGNSFM